MLWSSSAKKNTYIDLVLVREYSFRFETSEFPRMLICTHPYGDQGFVVNEKQTCPIAGTYRLDPAADREFDNFVFGGCAVRSAVDCSYGIE